MEHPGDNCTKNLYPLDINVPTPTNVEGERTEIETVIMVLLRLQAPLCG